VLCETYLYGTYNNNRELEGYTDIRIEIGGRIGGLVMSKYIVELGNVNKMYGTNHVVKDLSLQIKEGEFLTLLGSSGCGKTTTLRIIAGFEEPSEGTILVEGESVENKEPFERNVNTVFQSYALFPHMTIYDNIAYGLKIKKIKKDLIKKCVTEMLEMVQLSGYEKRYPKQLSGGQKQRVAIARALINKPKVLLLDEPLGALDLKLRKQMQLELKQLQKSLGITFVYVTHDQEEALTMSDRIGIMHEGVLEQLGTPVEIYEKPATRFVASFIGETNLFDGMIASISGDEVLVNVEYGTIKAVGKDFKAGELVSLSARPERILTSEVPVDGFTLCGVVKDHIYIGSVIKVVVVMGNGQELKIERLSREVIPEIGATVYPYWMGGEAVLLHSLDQTFYHAVENVVM
jgi:spermidine/putrescine transport system ATP-binding protein